MRSSKLFFASWFMSLMITPMAETTIGKVVGVSDGDTITVLDDAHRQHKIRLSGIDAPEIDQAFGDYSKRHLSDLVYGKTVTVEWSKIDKYGRILGKVLVDGKDANLSQINAGAAWHYKAYEMEQSPEDRTAYAEMERSARSNSYGLWWRSFPAPIPPWEYRHGKEGAPAISASTLTFAPQKHAASSSCPCSSHQVCIGPRGGRYCITSGGSRRYGR